MSLLFEIASVASRSHRTLLQDAAGLMALVVMLLVGLHIPSLI
ncbi:hypothetical protein [Roseobacter cerasinus]|nr:hypothetical protein [Roseobacter cerasinus]